MPARRSDKKDAAREEYLKRLHLGGGVNLAVLAKDIGVNYDTLRRWKSKERWDELPAPQKKKRGGQPKNQNARGNPGGGAPPRNNNARKHGGYAAVFFDRMTDEELAIINDTPKTALKALHEELGILKVREKRILDQIAELENTDEDELFISTLLDMRAPRKIGNENQDGAVQKLGMYTRESAFSRKMKLQEALYKVQGRIATVIGKIQQAEETDLRMALENKKLELAKMRATGAFQMPDDGEEGIIDDPIHE